MMMIVTGSSFFLSVSEESKNFGFMMIEVLASRSGKGMKVCITEERANKS